MLQTAEVQATKFFPVQVLRREPGARLLLCAPQNFSADLLASALSAKMPPSDMVRLNDPRRPPNQAFPKPSSTPSSTAAACCHGAHLAGIA